MGERETEYLMKSVKMNIFEGHVFDLYLCWETSEYIIVCSPVFLLKERQTDYTKVVCSVCILMEERHTEAL